MAICTLAAPAQSSKDALAGPAQAATVSLPDFDVARLTLRATGDLGLGHGEGSVGVTQMELRSLLARPIPLANDWLVVPLAEFTLTHLNLNDCPVGYPLHDDDLYSVGLSAFAVHLSQGSPWLYGGWARAELASDFDRLTSDALTFDFAAVAGYRYSEHLMVGFGAAVLNLNGDVSCYPAAGFDWIVNDAVRIGLYGPSFVASYAYSQDWLLSLRARAGGGVWNISDAAGNSQAADLTTYQLGVFADRRLTGKLWLSAGVGATVGNKLEITTPHGDTLFEREPDAGLFGQIGLRLKTW
jgi:hypothetical protein